MREKDGTCSTVFILFFFLFFFRLSLSLSFQLFSGPSVREKKTEQHRSRTLIKFPVSPTFLSFSFSLILSSYSCIPIFSYSSFAYIYYRQLDTIVYIVCCVCIAVKTPSVKLKFFFSN